VRLNPPGGGSVHRPAISGHRLAFLRVRPGGGTRQPDDLVEWTSAVTYAGGVAWSAGLDPGTGASASTAVELAPQVAWKAIARPRPHHVSPGF
jgi:hypothetical protein